MYSGHMYPSSTIDIGWFVAFESIQKFPGFLNSINYFNFVGKLHHSIWLQIISERFSALKSKFLSYFIWHTFCRITNEGSVSETSVWSILLIPTKLCIHLSGRYGDLIKQYEVPFSRMLHDIMDDDHLQWQPPLIRHYTNFDHITDLDLITEFERFP